MSNSSSTSGIDSVCGLEFEPLDVPATMPDRNDEIRRLALRYQVILDWSQELGFVAACTEAPNVAARTADADSCVARLFDSLVWHIAGLRAEQRPLPMPRPWSARNSGMRMVSDDADSFDAASRSTYAEVDPVIAPPSDQLLRMAEWTAHQYRVLINVCNGRYVAMSPEISKLTGLGSTAGECVADVRVKLVSRVVEMISANQMPPEPMQEVERRSAALIVTQGWQLNSVTPMAA